ncbi:MAG: hypothetical protein ABSE73_23520, partial [Planctomycetota bacterium]
STGAIVGVELATRSLLWGYPYGQGRNGLLGANDCQLLARHGLLVIRSIGLQDRNQLRRFIRFGRVPVRARGIGGEAATQQLNRQDAKSAKNAKKGFV